MKFNRYCEIKFPVNWEIEELGNGLYRLRDNLLGRGENYEVSVQEEVNWFEMILKFGDFAKELSDHALKSISDSNSPLCKLLEVNSSLKVVVRKQFVEINLDPLTNRFEGWSLNLTYKKVDLVDNADRFSDILLSFLLCIFPYDFETEVEGVKYSETISKYERSAKNRSICLSYYGYNCQACGVNLQEKYGEIARDFIHVHHLNPLSLSGVVQPDPIMDFVPLCPNCHSIAHLRTPPYTIEEIKLNLNSN